MHPYSWKVSCKSHWLFLLSMSQSLLLEAATGAAVKRTAATPQATTAMGPGHQCTINGRDTAATLKNKQQELAMRHIVSNVLQHIIRVAWTYCTTALRAT
jgi:hypothetical protein